jgi:hypothetical protein
MNLLKRLFRKDEKKKGDSSLESMCGYLYRIDNVEKKIIKKWISNVIMGGK